jgi:hypothetical protein
MNWICKHFTNSFRSQSPKWVTAGYSTLFQTLPGRWCQVSPIIHQLLHLRHRPLFFWGGGGHSWREGCDDKLTRQRRQCYGSSWHWQGDRAWNTKHKLEGRMKIHKRRAQKKKKAKDRSEAHSTRYLTIRNCDMYRNRKPYSDKTSTVTASQSQTCESYWAWGCHLGRVVPNISKL